VTLTVHVVAHTHWDREWYRPAAVFGLRLVRLVDDLLDFLPRRPDFPTFLLDGQAIVLDDYLQARPEREGRLRALFGEGRLEAGPWYVLADELLVSAESLVRNLMSGSRTVARLGGAPMAVGYSPDAFGHPAAFPAILSGFGLEVAVLWRGFGGEPGQEGDLYRWRSPDGSEVLMVHLPRPGYENGKNIPREREALAEWWGRLRAELEPRARSPHWLVLAGADHHAAQHDLPEAIAELSAIAPDVRFTISTLEGYARAVARWVREQRPDLRLVAGELRGGHRHAWALQGTHGSRLYLKQENAACQRLLERYPEPLVALAAARGGGDRRAELEVAWRSLLENHPHDSICGTSADPVHREMVTRFARCRAQGEEIVAHALEDVVGHDRAAARVAGREAWRPALLVFNPSPAPRSGVIEAEVALFESDVSVGQQRAGTAPALRPGPFRLTAGGRDVRFQVLGARDGHDLVESPLHYPVSSAVEWRRIAIAVQDLPPLGVAALEVIEGQPRRADRPGSHGAGAEARGSAAAVPRETDVLVEANLLRNERLQVRVEEAGTLELTDLASGEVYRGLGELWDNGDVGDSYTYSAPRPDRVVREPDAVAARVIHAGPLRGELEIVRRYRSIALHATMRVTLDAGATQLGLEIEGENRRTDHRLRIAFPLGVRPRREVADGHFGPVERSPGPAPRLPAGFEQPAPTAPMQRYVSAGSGSRGLTVLADGLPEYELKPDGTLLVTLLRAFGQLSREDMPERPGHAGWPTPTPDAQCLSPFRARLAVLAHAERDLDDPTVIERAAEAFHAPPLAAMRRSLLTIPQPVRGPELVGAGLVFSAMKPAERGRGIVLRCYDATAHTVAGQWRIPWPVRSAELARLDETPIAPLGIAPEGTIAFEAPPRAIVTLLAHSASRS
jgi:alpha-mannosidase